MGHSAAVRFLLICKNSKKILKSDSEIDIDSWFRRVRRTYDQDQVEDYRVRYDQAEEDENRAYGSQLTAHSSQFLQLAHVVRAPRTKILLLAQNLDVNSLCHARPRRAAGKRQVIHAGSQCRRVPHEVVRRRLLLMVRCKV